MDLEDARLGQYMVSMDYYSKLGDFLFQSMEKSFQYSPEQGNVWDTAFGMEYDANGRYLINIELVNRLYEILRKSEAYFKLCCGQNRIRIRSARGSYIADYTSNLCGVERNNTGFYFQYNKSFFHDTLTIEYVCYSEVRPKNAFHKIGFDYDFSDDIEFSMEYVFFQAPHDDSFLWNHRNEDRIGLEVKFYY